MLLLDEQIKICWFFLNFVGIFNLTTNSLVLYLAIKYKHNSLLMMNLVIALEIFTDYSLTGILNQNNLLISNPLISIARCVTKIYDFYRFKKCVSNSDASFLKPYVIDWKNTMKNFTRTTLSSFPVTHQLCLKLNYTSYEDFECFLFVQVQCGFLSYSTRFLTLSQICL